MALGILAGGEARALQRRVAIDLAGDHRRDLGYADRPADRGVGGHVPAGKQVVLGLVTSKRPQLESKDELKRRIDEAARYVPLEQLCLSPQCGFSSTVEGNALTRDEQIAKLALIVEVATEVWG